MTEPEYNEQKTALEAENAALEAEWAVASMVPYPAWMYHKTQGSRLVYSEAEAIALGRGWSNTPAPPVPPE